MIINHGYLKQPCVDGADKVSFYTCLPNVGVLKLVFGIVESQMSGGSKSLTKDETFFYLSCQTVNDLKT